MAVRITITWIDKEVVKFLNDKNFIKAFNKRFSTKVIGFINHAKSAVRNQMKSGNYSLLGITQYTAEAGPKSPSKVFFDTNRFSESLRGHFVRDSETLTGLDFNFEGSTSRGLPFANLAWILEEGRTWPPTQKERIAVAIKASRGGAPEAEGTPKPAWSIPPRPFLSDTFSNQKTLQLFFDRTFDALDLALEDMKKG